MEWSDWNIVILTAAGIAIGGIFRDAIIKSWYWVVKKIPFFKDSSKDDGIEIEGSWETTFVEKGQEYHELVTVQKNRNHVSGEIKLKDPKDPSANPIEIYKFEGIFKERVLTATYENADRKSYERGAFALLYEKRTFEGHYIFFSSESGKEGIKTSNYKWIRK